MANSAIHKLVRNRPCLIAYLFIPPEQLTKKAYLNYPPCTRAFRRQNPRGASPRGFFWLKFPARIQISKLAHNIASGPP